MSTKIINYIEQVRPYMYTYKNVFSFQPQRKHRWLQKLCFFVLEKLNCYHVETRESISKITFDLPQIDDKIRALLHEYTKRQPHRADYIVIGTNDLFDLHKISMSSTLWLEPNKYLGYNLIIVPWISGCFILPNIDDITKVKYK